jgi:hypothetical protein
VGKPSDAPRQRNLARGLHEWNRAVCIISTMAIGLQRVSPSIGRCPVVDVVVVEGVRQGSNSKVLGPKQECFPRFRFHMRKHQQTSFCSTTKPSANLFSTSE